MNREDERIRRSKTIKELSKSKVIKDIVRETVRKSKTLPKSRRPAAGRKTLMTAEDVVADIEKEAEDVAELRKAMALGTIEESKNV